MKVKIGDSSSGTVLLTFGVPQSSCAGPVIFTMYIAALNRVVRNYPTEIYRYADDHKVAFKIQV